MPGTIGDINQPTLYYRIYTTMLNVLRTGLCLGSLHSIFLVSCLQAIRLYEYDIWFTLKLSYSNSDHCLDRTWVYNACFMDTHILTPASVYTHNNCSPSLWSISLILFCIHLSVSRISTIKPRVNIVLLMFD